MTRGAKIGGTQEFRRRLVVATIVPLGLALALASILTWQVTRLLSETRWVEHTDQVISSAHRVFKLLIDHQTGQRGYLLTGKDEFLEPYRNAEMELDRELAALRERVEDDHLQVERMELLEESIADWREYAQSVIAKRQAGEDYLSQVTGGEGKRRMDRIRTQLARFIGTEERLRNERSQSTQRAARVSLFLIAGLTAAFGAFVALRSRRDLGELVRTFDDTLEVSRRDQERIRALVNGVRDYAIVLLDREGRVLEWNLGAERIIGYSAEEIRERDHRMLFTPEDVRLQRPEQLLREAAEQGRVEESGFRVRKDGSRFWAETVVTRLRDRHGEAQGFSQVMTDATFRRQVEAERSFLLAKLREAVRSRDEFLSQASHELKTPLTSLTIQVHAALEALRRDRTTPPQDRYERFLGASKAQLDRLSRLIEDMLDLAHIHSGSMALDFKPTNLSAVVQDVLARLEQHRAQSGSTVTTDIQPDVVGQWDRDRIEQVVSNLLVNALTYAAGSSIRIAVRAEHGRAMLIVSDTGPGIPKSAQERIFDSMVRASSTDHHGGLGIGLFLAKRIVDSHGGTIRVESEPGRGANFIVELPEYPSDRDDLHGEAAAA